jgi:hypothetical protein
MSDRLHREGKGREGREGGREEEREDIGDK